VLPVVRAQVLSKIIVALTGTFRTERRKCVSSLIARIRNGGFGVM
jgi:hypothetical protein